VRNSVKPEQMEEQMVSISVMGVKERDITTM
jgi:hypothetical protein